MNRRRRWHRSSSQPARPVLRQKSSFRLEQMGRRDHPIAQLPSIGVRVAILGGVAVAVFAVIVFRLWFLQILTGEQYVAAANNNRLRPITLAARRGLILDRDGTILVDNKPRLIVGIRLMDVPEGQLRSTIVKLSTMIDLSQAEIWERLALHTGFQYTWTPIASGVENQTAAKLNDLAVENSGFKVENGTVFVHSDLVRGRRLAQEATALASPLHVSEKRLTELFRAGRKEKQTWIAVRSGLDQKRQLSMRKLLLPFIVVNGEAQMKVMNILEHRVDATLRQAAMLVHKPIAELYAADGVYAGAHYDLIGIKDLIGVKADVAQRIMTEVLERSSELPGVEVHKDFTRGYPKGTLAAHLLGTIGEINAQQLEEPQWKSRQSGDIIGQAGVEYTYDKWLRGEDGAAQVEVDALGRPKKAVKSGGKSPVPGDSLVLTIDAKVQKAAEQALINGIQLAHDGHFWKANGGAAIAMDAETGEIMAMASYPTYDPSVYDDGISSKEARQLYSGETNTPLLDRPIQGLYPAGSTFKVIDSVAALETGLITPYSTFWCNGLYKKAGQPWKCWVYPEGHGTLNLEQALAQSCDVYFYNVGYLFLKQHGTPLQDWARKLGLGQQTGIDVPGEYSGLMPTQAWKQRHFEKGTWDYDWHLGDSVNLAIGQGYISITPMQMAVAYAAIANGGKIVTPHLGREVKDATGRVVQKLRWPIRRNLSLTPAYLNAIRAGLRQAATSSVGTSSAVFGNYPVAISGKTGTAQWPPKDDIAWYASYGTANGHTYVVITVIEQGGHGGSVAAPAARQIYDALFHVKSEDTTTGTIRSD